MIFCFLSGTDWNGSVAPLNRKGRSLSQIIFQSRFVDFSCYPDFKFNLFGYPAVLFFVIFDIHDPFFFVINGFCM